MSLRVTKCVVMAAFCRKIGSSADGEGHAAAAGRSRVGIAHGEIGPDEILCGMKFAADHEFPAHVIDQDSHAIARQNVVVVFFVIIEGKAVLKSGATAA